MRRFLIVLGAWCLYVVCNDIMDTVIFHQSNMIFQGGWFDYPIIYKGLFGDAWHTAKLVGQGIMVLTFAYLISTRTNNMSLTSTRIKFIWYSFVLACASALVHYIFFHNLFIK